jgi:hypothetical protein
MIKQSLEILQIWRYFIVLPECLPWVLNLAIIDLADLIRLIVILFL